MQSQQHGPDLRQLSLWHDGCNILRRHSKLQVMAQTSLSDKFSLGSTARSPKEDV
jgi:hypothetical protein